MLKHSANKPLLNDSIFEC